MAGRGTPFLSIADAALCRNILVPVSRPAVSTPAVETTALTMCQVVFSYFEPNEMAALLAAPSGNRKTGRRNQMMLIFLYDTAAKVGEARHVKVSGLHLDAEVPYVTLLGKSRKYRNIPLLEKTVLHAISLIDVFPAPRKCVMCASAGTETEADMNTKLAATQIRMTQWAAIIKDRCDSGLKADDYCEQHGLSRNAYYYWLRKVSMKTIHNFLYFNQ